MTEKEAPRKYKLFDGFLKSNLLVKTAYVLTFPSLVVPAIVEGLEYRNVQNQIEGYEDRQLNAVTKRLQAPSTNYSFEHTANENMTKNATHFQDMATKNSSEALSR